MDCSSNAAAALAGTARVLSCREIQPDVFLLALEIAGVAAPKPRAGQFYLLRSRPSATLLCRPISVWRAQEREGALQLEFLILKKGRGTEQLCSLTAGSRADVIGPLGNSFAVPAGFTGKIAVIGGGIGVAPVAGFAQTLSAAAYDFYGAFRSTPYGLDHIQAAKLSLCTDDGSSGVKGMLPAIFAAGEAASYGLVYACGPDAMLAYVQKVCREAKTPCFLSTEAHMACGVGACLGCTVKTVNGNKRCCKDGPVFDGSELIFREGR